VAAKVKQVAGKGQIRFGYKSNKPTKKGRAAIAAAAKLLASCPTLAVTIRGYADLTGPAKVNKKISVIRAKAVRTQLRALGVTNDMTVKGLGDKHSVANNSSAKGRAANRRAEIVIP
jgi:OOP family OmpA-OmpF porin